MKSDFSRLLEHLLLLPKETNLSSIYVVEFNSRLYVSLFYIFNIVFFFYSSPKKSIYYSYPLLSRQKILDSKEFKYHLKKVIDIDNNISNLVMFL